MVISEVVIRECQGGDADAARRRMTLIQELRTIELLETAESLARTLVSECKLPHNAAIDALHVAVAASHGINFMLTLNCSHLASAVFRPRIESACREQGFEPPVICTPHELM